MGFWESFWGGLLLVGLLGFAVQSLIVALGGFKEIRALFEGIEAQHEDEDRGGGHENL